MVSIIKLAYYLKNNSYNSELSLLQDLIKTASEKDAKYLMGINLSALRKEFPREEGEDEASMDKAEKSGLIREYYGMLGEMAKRGPYFSEEAINFIRDNIDEGLIPSNRKEFIKWLGSELNKLSKRKYPDINDIAMIRDWLVGTGWPEDSKINLLDIELDYALSESKEWHKTPASEPIEGLEVKKRVMFSADTGETIVYEPIAAVDPIARKKLGQDLGLCLMQGLYSDNADGFIYSLRSSRGKAGACIRIEHGSNEVMEIKGPGNRAASITVQNAKIIKEWIKSKNYALSRMGRSDYEAMPPTTWEEAKKLWQSSRTRFFQKGWYRGYRKEFEPELKKMLNDLFVEERFGRDSGWVFNAALKSGAHHVYSNVFAKYLPKIAEIYPVSYLEHNLPRTYSSKKYDKVHKSAVDKLVDSNPEQVIGFINPAARRTNFDESILNMLKDKEGDAVRSLLAKSKLLSVHTEKSTPQPGSKRLGPGRYEGVDSDLLWSISSAFNNSSILKKYPKIMMEVTETMIDGLKAASEEETNFPRHHGGYRGLRHPMMPEDVIKNIIKSRTYRLGGVFEKLIKETVEDLTSSIDVVFDYEKDIANAPGPSLRGRNPNRATVIPDFFRSPDSFFRLGLHTTREYRSLTEDMAESMIGDLKQEGGGGSGYIDLYVAEKYLLNSKIISDEKRKQIAEIKLRQKHRDSHRAAVDYLREKKYYANPLFADVTAEAINSLPFMKEYAELKRDPLKPFSDQDSRRVDGLNSDYLLMRRFPEIIRNTEGIVPEELTEQMKKVLFFSIKRNKTEALYRHQPGWGFITNPKNKEFEEIKIFILENSLRASIHNINQNIDKEVDFERIQSNYNTRNQIYDIQQQFSELDRIIRLLRYIKKFDLENQLKALPVLLTTIGKYSQKTSEDLNKIITIVSKRKPGLHDTDEDDFKGKAIELANEHLKYVRKYINIGMHKTKPEYNEQLSSAIEEANKYIFGNLRELYRKHLETNMLDWRLFGPRTNADNILGKYYYNDPDYPVSLYEKDEEILYDLKDEIDRIYNSFKVSDESFGDFVYGFMYWSVTTFNQMGEEAAAQGDSIGEYIEHFKDLWPKRSAIKDDEFFHKGYIFRDQIERSIFPEVRRPVSYDEEEVSQQIAKDYFEDMAAYTNEPDYDAPQTEDELKQEEWENKQLEKKQEEARRMELEDEDVPDQMLAGPQGDSLWRSDRADEPYDSDNLPEGSLKRARMRKIKMLNKLSSLNVN
jgi:hypothetical protein